jgi:hypothetical protein
MNNTNFIITPVPIKYAPTVWADIERVLAPAVKTANGRIGLDDFFIDVVEGNTVVWLVLENLEVIGAFTTRVAKYPKSKSLIIDWVGGKKLFRWIDAAMSIIKEQARIHGCDSVEGYGRKAWTRAIRRHGFVPECIVYRMEVNNGRG